MFGQSLLSAFGSAACTTDTDQLFATDVQTTSVATYQLNNATTSIPSNTYPGTPTNITYAAGKFGNAAVFNGSSSYITINSTSTTPFDASTENFTISAWINVSTFQNDATIITKYGASSSTQSYQLGFQGSGNNTKLVFYEKAVGSTVVHNSSTVIISGQWYHIGLVRNSTQVIFYINGSSETISATNSINDGGSQSIIIGRQDGYSSTSFNGSIDQIRIFNTALPQSAVTALYNETTTTATYPYVDYVNTNPNSVAYYKMSDATDQFGNYNGTATNVNFNTEGKFGFAGGFNGSSSRIQMPNNSFNYTTMSFSGWVNPSAANPVMYIFQNLTEDNRIGGSIGWYVRRQANGALRARGFSSTSLSLAEFDISSATGIIPLNTWTNVVCVLTPTSFNMYVNGNSTAVASATLTNPVTYSSSQPVTVYIGTNKYYSSGDVYESFWEGSIDQIRIYDSALSAENVTALYEEIECPAVTSDTYLVVGGGAGSGSYGGGGAGGYLSNFNRNSIEFTTGTVYTITVGAGGATSSSGGSAGTNGDASVLSGSNITTITASGGGYGGNLVSSVNANSGASGGGGASDGAGAGGAASPAGQGNAGGIGAAAHPNYSGGGGGGAGAVGNAGSGANGGNGGVGIETSITGTATYFAGGGGGTGYAYPNPGTSGTGGSGGGGTANPYGSTSTVSNATPNTGGGGGGNGAVYSNGSGGSGIVVLRYSSTKSITIASGSLSTGTLNTSIGSDKYTTFIGGTGTVTFS